MHLSSSHPSPSISRHKRARDWKGSRAGLCAHSKPLAHSGREHKTFFHCVIFIFDGAYNQQLSKL